MTRFSLKKGASREIAGAAQVVTKGSRDLQDGNYHVAVARLDRALRQGNDPALEPLVKELLKQATTWRGTERSPIVEAVLDFRVAGLRLILAAIEGGLAQVAVSWSQQLLERFPDDSGALTLQSLALEFKGDFRAALEVCDRLVEVDPRNHEAFLRRAAVRVALANQADEEARERQGHQHGAIADYAAALELEPTVCFAHLLRARVELEIGDMEEAENDLDAALECDPGLVEARYERASLLEWRGEYDRAHADYDAVVRDAPEVSLGYLGRGRILAERGRLDEADADFGQAVALEPTLVEAHYHRASLDESRGDYEGALLAYDEIVRLLPDDPRGHLGRADVLSAVGDDAAARLAYDRALELGVADEAALRGRALASLNLGDRLALDGADEDVRRAYESAVEDLDAVLELDPRDVLAHWYRGLALRSLDGHDLAADAFGRALEGLDPDEADLRSRLLCERGEALRLWGNTLGLHNRLEEAVREFEAAEPLREDSDFAWAWAALGAALTELGRHEAADEAFETALAGDPTSAWARVGRSKLLLRMERASDALAELAKAVNADADSPSEFAWVHVLRGQALEQLGAPDDVSSAYEAALASPDEASAYLVRGTLFEDVGSEDALSRAEADYRQALSLDPDSADARNNLAWLYVERLRTPAHLEEAVRLAAEAVELVGSGPSRGYYLDTLGWAYYRLGRVADAIGPLTEAKELAPYRLIRRAHLEAAGGRATPGYALGEAEAGTTA